jgi:hypothetical protein
MLADVSAMSVVTWSLILVAFIVAGWVTVWQVRRRLANPDETAGTGFTLSDLRRLHKSGQMSDEEFERAKAQVVDAARRATAREAAAALAKQPGRRPPGPEQKP